ncbi:MULTISPECIES: HAD hydrolase-like protein [unclassified Mesorhizobium]|uniref:HAD hydrolase-like protein n=1 Tax=unclassified Mesorhizobium TaxID=325217 RepID=UPI003014F8B9
MDISARRQAVLFDLDGTLTDPFVGITKSLQYAVEKLGRVAPAADDLRWCIGPPIKSAFGILIETEDPDLIDEGVRLYRERYSDVGKFENVLIEGIPEVLAELVADGYFLSVATSKLKTYAGEIIDHFDLRRYFNVVHGSELDGRNSVKGDLIAHILAVEPIDPARTVMIGDRSHDVVGAKLNGIETVGVLWGYGDRKELEEAGAARIAKRPAELRQLIGALLEPA